MFFVALLMLLAAGCVKCEQLTQPASMSVQPGQTLTISCQVSYSVTSYHTHWIRQPTGKALEWMGVIWTDGNKAYASSVRGRIEITRDINRKTLHLRLSTMKPEDSAVYYCAKETQWLIKAERLYKNSQSRKQELHQHTITNVVFVFCPKEGDVVINGKGGPVNVSAEDPILSKGYTYYFVAFSNQTIHSCEMNGTFSNNEAEKAKLNFYLLMMNAVRMVPSVLSSP
ncbi:uncharacterized protein LOC119781709 [Cyprinodon tularosa]|uniref:uncharacterized protein LOC119781709 n=1 Tax=Cyprinodon tularosa TaxID=77115 RepID=UPI0018E1EEF6|nr:uncharacterized protein LOC119781709 [Cyprinodon tularosa]